MSVQNVYLYGAVDSTPTSAATNKKWAPIKFTAFNGAYVTPQSPDTGFPELFETAQSGALNQQISLAVANRSIPVGASYTYAYAKDKDSLEPVVGELNTDGIDARNDGFYGLRTTAFSYTFNGTTFDSVRSGSAANLANESGTGAIMSTRPGNWSVNHTPAANTQATISKAAGAAGVRHICTSITATLIGLAASVETTVLVNLRDGSTGAGTILWSTRLLVTGTSGSETGVTLSNLNIVGSAATAMTLEFAAAGGASTFESVAMTGYDAS